MGWLCAAAMPFGLAGGAAGQSPTTGSVSGVVRDATGELMGNVFLTLRDEGTDQVRSQYTDRDGGYRFGLLLPGEYELTVEKLGYGPKRQSRIPVRPGSEVRLDQELRALDPAAARVEVVEYAGRVVSGSRPGSTQWLSGWAVRGLPHERRGLGDVARLMSNVDGRLGVEGLPGTLTAVAVDGVVFRPAAHPLLRTAPLRGTAFGVDGVSSVELVTGAADAEWGGAAGGFLSAHSSRGTPELEVEGRGAWTGSVLPGPSFGDGLTYNDAQGGLVVRTSLLEDSARLSAGLHVQRLQTPVSRTWDDSPTAVTLSDLGSSFGLDLASYRRSGLSESASFAGHVRFDWSLAGRHEFGAWTHLASQPELPGVNARLGTLQSVEGADLIAGASLRSEVGSGIRNEARVGVTSSWRATGEPSSVGPTWIVSDGLVLGGVRTAARGEETRVQLSDALHLTTGRHAVKLGAGISLNSQRYDYREGSDGEVYFGSLNDVLASRGLLVRTDGAVPASRWSTAVPSLFLQDRWNAGHGLDVLVGVRVERVPLPSGEVRRDAEWEQLSGLRNDSVGKASLRRQARVAFTWDVQEAQRWVLHASAGIYTGEADPLLLNQWISDADGRVRREIGLTNWPTDPAGGGTLRRTTMLAPGFTGPITTRGGGGLTYRLSPAAALHLSGAVRRTENLPRRTDLNVTSLPAYRDQHDRPIYGTLVKQGALLAAEPGTGRRFYSQGGVADYDEVAGINADGWSDYWGLTAGIEYEMPAGANLVARYTFSRTRDNWFGGREGGWTIAPPGGLDTASEWAEGPSDFDVPHRLIAALALPLPMSSTASAVYRFESGLPFTPGFRRGVDANADGSPGNDPAFIDPAIAGMSELLGRWSCLSESRGRFAARNSCRGPAAHSLDLAFGIDVLRLGTGTMAFTAEAFDVLESGRTIPDAALYLVDPEIDLTMNDAGTRVTVPLQVNPEFGEALVRPHGGRSIRLGFAIRW